MAKAKCKVCGEVIVSEHGGHFVTCKCGKSSLDTDRWFPELVKVIGEAELIPSDKQSNKRGEMR